MPKHDPIAKSGEARPQKAERLRLCPVFYLFLGIALLAVSVHVYAAHSTDFANGFGKTVSPLFRMLLGYISALSPVSLAEMILLLLPLWIILLFLLARRLLGDVKKTSRMLSLLLCVPLLLYSLFVFSFATGYYTTPLAERLGYEDTQPNKENLYAISLMLAEGADACAREADVTVTKTGSVMPFTFAEMNQKLIAAYDVVCEKYDFISHFAVGVKPVVMSHPMAYTHITGVYSFMTGEMNVCTAFSDYSIIYTAAHEMAHARGIAREDEANFVAFLVLSASEDPYFRYAGNVMLLQYVSNALYDTDSAKYKEAWSRYPTTVVNEIRAYNAIVREYSGTMASEVAGSINNAYLEGMGTGGSISYDLVVRLAVGHFSNQSPK